MQSAFWERLGVSESIIHSLMWMSEAAKAAGKELIK